MSQSQRAHILVVPGKCRKLEAIPGARCGRCKGVVVPIAEQTVGALGTAFAPADLASIMRDEGLALHLQVHPSESNRNEAASKVHARCARPNRAQGGFTQFYSVQINYVHFKQTRNLNPSMPDSLQCWK